MIKILILIAVVILTASIGVILSANRKKRMQVFAELYEFNEQLILTLKFSRASIEKVASSFKYVTEILKGDVPLSGEDGKFIIDYKENLGKTDALSQIDYLSERKSFLKKYKEESFADYKKYSSLYLKIFLLIGILIAVLLA